MSIQKLIIFVVSLFFPFLAISELHASDHDQKLLMELKYGTVVIQMLPEIAPLHVKRIKELVREKFYDGLVFHRVIGGFMAQGGDPTGSGRGGSGQNIPAEFSKEPHIRGIVSMARSSDPNSADSQFFIVFQPAPWLDGKYSVWGRVISGMEYIDRLKKGDDPASGVVKNPDKIIEMYLAVDRSE